MEEIGNEKFLSNLNQTLDSLISKAEENDTSSIVKLLRQPEYAELLHQRAPSDFTGELRSLTKRNCSLLASLCDRVDQQQNSTSSPIPTWLPMLIRIIIAALPEILVPPSCRQSVPWSHVHYMQIGGWTHPVNLLCRGDPLYLHCREAMFDDVRWSPDVHPLLPTSAKATYVLLARVLWKYDVLRIGHIFQMVSSFLPPVIKNSSSKFAFRTPLEIANDKDFKLTLEFWNELVFYPAVTQITGVPEIRNSGKRCCSIAYSRSAVNRLYADHIQDKLIEVTNEWELRALGLSLSTTSNRRPCNIAMTDSQHQSLFSIAADKDPNNDGRYSDWFNFPDRIATYSD